MHRTRGRIWSEPSISDRVPPCWCNSSKLWALKEQANILSLVCKRCLLHAFLGSHKVCPLHFGLELLHPSSELWPENFKHISIRVLICERPGGISLESQSPGPDNWWIRRAADAPVKVKHDEDLSRARGYIDRHCQSDRETERSQEDGEKAEIDSDHVLLSPSPHPSLSRVS
jgi:hypothetical protein